MPDDDFAPPTAAERQLFNTIYNGNAAEPLPPPAKGGGMHGMHSYSPAAEVIKQRGGELFAATGMNADGRRELEGLFREMQKSTGLPDGLVAEIAGGHIDNLLAASNVPDDVEGDAIARDQRIAESNRETRERLQGQYGKDAEQLLERAQRFVRRHSRVAAVLRERGLGSRPEIVESLVAHVFSTGFR